VLAFKTVVLPSFPRIQFYISSVCNGYGFFTSVKNPLLCFESADQAPSNEDVLCKVLTALGALRSEFPSRKTGFTAEPKTLNILL
jgi:hypothetical protein